MGVKAVRIAVLEAALGEPAHAEVLQPIPALHAADEILAGDGLLGVVVTTHGPRRGIGLI